MVFLFELGKMLKKHNLHYNVYKLKRSRAKSLSILPINVQYIKIRFNKKKTHVKASGVLTLKS